MTATSKVEKSSNIIQVKDNIYFDVVVQPFYKKFTVLIDNIMMLGPNLMPGLIMKATPCNFDFNLHTTST